MVLPCSDAPVGVVCQCRALAEIVEALLALAHEVLVVSQRQDARWLWLSVGLRDARHAPSVLSAVGGKVGTCARANEYSVCVRGGEDAHRF